MFPFDNWYDKESVILDTDRLIFLFAVSLFHSSLPTVRDTDLL
jgi:hypothetical protein